jgi:DNA-binding response OmpR family regulator
MSISRKVVIPGIRGLSIFMIKVLLLCNDDSLCNLIDYTLSYSGYEVLRLSSIENDKKISDRINSDFILCDFNFLDHVLNSNVKRYIIVMGECADEHSILDKMHEGVDDYVLKPFEMQEIKMIFHKHIKRMTFISRNIYKKHSLHLERLEAC